MTPVSLGLCGKFCGGCATCTARETDPDYAKVREWRSSGKVPVRKRICLPITRPYRCLRLGKRIEFPGCPGKSVHDCLIGYAAVPCGNCQRCESYVEDEEEKWI